MGVYWVAALLRVSKGTTFHIRIPRRFALKDHYVVSDLLPVVANSVMCTQQTAGASPRLRLHGGVRMRVEGTEGRWPKITCIREAGHEAPQARTLSATSVPRS